MEDQIRLNNDQITLKDIPKVPETFCQNAPTAELREACNACRGISEYTCKKTHTEYSLSEGDILKGAEAEKCCALELKESL